MTNEQIISVLELGKNPLFNHTTISSHRGTINAGIVSIENADTEQVKALVSEIFPDASYSEADEWFQEDGGSLRKIHFSWVTGGMISLHLIKKEAPQQEGATQENSQLDYTSIDELVAREA